MKECIEFVHGNRFLCCLQLHILRLANLCWHSQLRTKNQRMKTPRTDTKVLQFLLMLEIQVLILLDIFFPLPHSFLVQSFVVQNRSRRPPPCQMWQAEKTSQGPLPVFFYVVSFASWGFNCRLTSLSKASFIHAHWHTSPASATVIYITQTQKEI